MKDLDDTTEPELEALPKRVADAIRDRLPPKTMFCLLVFGTPGRQGIGQYIADCDRRDCIDSIKEFVTAPGRRKDIPR